MNFLRTYFGIGLPWWPWRYEELKWDKNHYESLMREVISILPTKSSQVKKLKIVVIGPKGHGKSSLINSFASISAGKQTAVCNAADHYENITSVFRYYNFPGKLENVSVGDAFGLRKEPSAEETKQSLQILKKLSKGHIKAGYKFKASKQISEEDDHYIKNPAPEDKIHCVIIVYDCATALNMHESHTNALDTIIKFLNKWNIPVVAVLTKADKKSMHVAYDIQSIFRSSGIKDAVASASKSLHIPAAYVHPVVNFEEKCEYEYDWKNSIPLLLALRSCLNLAQGHLHNAN